MIRVVVLGSSASAPSKDCFPSCFAVKYGPVLLFDCCEGAQKQMMRYKISYSRTKAIFLTHLHADHFLGVFGLVQTMNLSGRKEPLQIFGPRGTKKFFETIFSLRHLAPQFPVEARDVSTGKIFEEDLFEVRPFAVKHAGPSLGYVLEQKPYRRFDEEKARKAGIRGRLFTDIQEKGRVTAGGKTIEYDDVTYVQQGKKIVYTGDTLPCASIAGEAKDADLLVHDACFADEDKEMAAEKKHATSRQAAEAAKKAGAKKLLLTHFSNRYDDRKPLLEEARKIFPDSILAEEGLELLI
ncbi:MAG: ribonuclease Z [Candidatus Micrarchaeota archaeon]|nr:ribonuclease Z [Candidatus Micrarchaeota archaeon]